MKYLKSFLAITLTILSIAIVWYHLVINESIPWYISLASAVLLVLADMTHKTGHYLTVALMFVGAAFYGAVVCVLLVVLKTNFLTAMFFVFMIVFIFHTYTIERNMKNSKNEDVQK